MSLSELEWVVAGYALTFAAFMLTGGKLADYVGRRLIFMVGLAVFTGASLACGLAPNGGFLIGARVVQGLGGALMNPATLSIITATFPPRERGKAIGIWAGVSGDGACDRPARRRPPDRARQLELDLLHQRAGRDHRPARDSALHRRVARHLARAAASTCPGSLTSAVGLFSLTYAFIEANNYGWTSARILGAFAVAAVTLVAFVLLERHQRAPMLELALFNNRTFSGANALDALRRARDVRDVLLRLALHAERSRLLAGPDGRELPADDAPDHR